MPETEDRNLTVSPVPDKGRCLLATRDFCPGDIIISQKPYVCVPNNSSAETRGDGCFASSKLKKCSGCQVVRYCISTCQRAEWKLHRLECEVLSRLEKNKRKSVTPSIRLMVKLYLRRKLQREKFACNAHTICDSELRPLGTGLYPVISIINHSCLPISVLVFEGRSAVVRAVQHNSKGSEVLISYIETSGTTMTRQKALKEQYLFTCACPCCVRMEAVAVHKIIEKFQSELCHPFSISLMQTRENLLKKMIVFCNDLSLYIERDDIMSFSVVDGAGTLERSSGILQIGLTSLSKYLGGPEGAVKSLAKAVDVLRITHGTNTPFGKEFFMKLEEARAEASYQQSSKDE